MSVTLWITGINPEPWSAGTAYKRGPHAVGIAKDGKLRAYQDALIDEFPVQNPNQTMLDKNDTKLDVSFYFWRQTAANGAVADATNMQKATEDALQGLLYSNDRNNHKVSSTIMEQTPTTEPCIMIVVDHFRRDRILIIPKQPVTTTKWEDDEWTAPEKEMF